ncbi:GNAT family N-acetyltransferase [Amycolatopsis sp. PS_44_ISF1]|uniref:GNAT family N-acetyltransferase n=1 Tax=Amycolatopsis sp. PS_44_ISF1 TaxID=2974917 RepID=UPI0028DF88A3|nr:GNAT family N-acetyltransferase [Amycolatopsis sp. PS_44_ISF1]MDT8909452.1 GNAT family N-acetyltransferase [Amycolatopsis sp. PS_44_ISF1]
MNAPEKLEIVCARAWPPVVERPLGQWRLRWADGFTGRANSALAVGDPGTGVPAALKAVCDFAHDRAIPPVVQVIEDSEQERAVAGAGWVEWSAHAAGHQVSVLTGPLPDGPLRGGSRARVAVLDRPTPGWWELTVDGREPGAAARHVLTTGDVGYGVAVEGGVTAGAVRGAVVDGWLHVSRLAVRPGFRRRGLASALMHGLAGWGRGRGAGQWVLQVAVDNAGAVALYSALGCTEHHRYRYWGPGPGACEDPQS